MALKTSSLISLLMIVFAISVQAQTKVFPKLKANFENEKVFVADFEHVYYDSYTKESLSSQGKIRQRKPIADRGWGNFQSL